MSKKLRAWVEGEGDKQVCGHCGDQSVLMRFPGGTGDHGIDPCLAPIVRALNDAGIPTAASCCGHGSGMGNIWLADGRVLAVLPDYEHTYVALYDLAIWSGLVHPREY
jgi:hypothetical protein